MVMKEANSDKIIRDIYKSLSKSIMICANASANLFWVEKEDIDTEYGIIIGETGYIVSTYPI